MHRLYVRDAAKGFEHMWHQFIISADILLTLITLETRWLSESLCCKFPGKMEKLSFKF